MRFGVLRMRGHTLRLMEYICSFYQRKGILNMTNKEKYQSFCKSTYIPVFSQPWWMDAVCGEDNWDVFVVEKGGIYVAAMPYYHEERNGYQLITKAKNTQNNGIIIKYPTDQKYTTKLGYEEAISLLNTSPSPRDISGERKPSSA